MKTVAIISEYNPFHLGHQHQIDKIREEFGYDTAIIAIMSGNFTQRGEVAFMSKTARAKAAVTCGVNLVLELPFPFCASSAEFFAQSGVKIANSLGIVDYLSFGSECGDIDYLEKCAAVFSGEEYKRELSNLSNEKNLGHPQKCELAFKKVCPDLEINLEPNNILAIEYIKALKTQGSNIQPHTVKRCGSPYNDSSLSDNINPSAMAIRRAYEDRKHLISDFIPANAMAVLNDAIVSADAPCSTDKLSVAIISHFRLNPPNASMNFHDAGDGLYNRLYNASFKANDVSSLLAFTETKKFTKARIRRAILNSFFGVTSSDLKVLPLYTQVLAMDSVGRSVLKSIKKTSEFPVITKPASYKDMGDEVIRQKELSNKADSIYALTLKNENSGRFPLIFTPYVKD